MPGERAGDRGLAPEERAGEIRRMFSQIVPRYDLMNRVMTAGRDGRWRNAAARAAVPPALAGRVRVLDLGAWTGDLARAVRRAAATDGATQVICADFARPMLVAGREKRDPRTDAGLDWLVADALRLPFPDATFDAVTSGFLLRNLVDLRAGLAEMLRVTRPGGRVVALDLTPPPPGLRGAVLRAGFRYLVTPVAGVLSSDRQAYRYLPLSLEGYLAAEALADLFRNVGASAVEVRRLGGGTVALHVATKAPR